MPEDTIDSLISDSIPDNKEEVRVLITNLTKELMLKTKLVKTLKDELASARKLKKVKFDPSLKTVALVLFSRPKSGGKIRMHVIDNCKGNLAMASIKRTMGDPDHTFLGAHLLQPMEGKPDSYARLTSNSECVWHLFERLDNDLKIYDPNKPEESPEE